MSISVKSNNGIIWNQYLIVQSLLSHVSTRHTMSRLSVAQIAASSSSFGSRPPTNKIQYPGADPEIEEGGGAYI